MEIDSVPTELDDIQRKIMQLTIEQAALKNENDEMSKRRLEKIEMELEEYQTKEKQFSAVYDKEKSTLKNVKDLKNQLEKARYQYENSMAKANYEEAGRLQYYVIPELEKKIAESESAKDANQVLNEIVTEEIIEEIVSSWTGIPVVRLVGSEIEKVINLEERLKQRVFGQDQALHLVAETIKRSKAGINDSKRPIGSFLFLGPTGVGKTEVAKALAFNLFGSDNKIIRLDMSEYMEKFSASRLLGAPPGYVGYDEGGQLSEAVRRSPYSIVLFDEIEKADREVFNILLQILDEGHATDSHGVKIDFRNTIIIMTSNLGANLIIEKHDNYQNELQRLLRSTFKPEFLNRIDEVVTFNSLTAEQLSSIIEKFIGELNKRISEQNISISLTPKAIFEIKNAGFDPDYGARPIKRFIQKRIEGLLATAILKGEVQPKNQYLIDFNGFDFFISATINSKPAE
jgi:ATP-dependent Clp protease ATP-binding subunit ClpB